MIDRYLDAKKKHYLDVEGNYKMDIDVKIYEVYPQFFISVFKDTLISIL